MSVVNLCNGTVLKTKTTFDVNKQITIKLIWLAVKNYLTVLFFRDCPETDIPLLISGQLVFRFDLGRSNVKK
jgi:hypothetical protein